ncbi:MAG: SDR family NAD(P)-dependent oxidoreductase [Actinobacteria bacterium]|nr:SDR family NAD(P)-dependent oxidoreductase [Actinomycetota bacterium]MBU2686425.1 SDR family NAD(P)-dependent oxidoreductase [Actinomycetota bacterium]
MRRDHLERTGRRTAVITGAGSGLGRSLALNLARQGWTIGISDVDAERAGCTLELVEKAGGSGEAYRCDVRDADQVGAMARRFFAEWGGVSLLVNNAGIAVAGSVGDAEISEWRRIVDVNLMGCVNGCHAFIPMMKSNGGGHIVNVASFAGIMNLPEMAPYNMTKAGVISLSETLSMELAGDRIGVTVVCPTFFETNLLDTMTCTNEFQTEFARSAFRNARITCDEVAACIIRGARKGKLYVMPQTSARLSWLAKRFFPLLTNRVFALGYRYGIARPVIMWMSKHGMV